VVLDLTIPPVIHTTGEHTGGIVVCKTKFWIQRISAQRFAFLALKTEMFK
jgi:hypothetical protein